MAYLQVPGPDNPTQINNRDVNKMSFNEQETHNYSEMDTKSVFCPCANSVHAHTGPALRSHEENLHEEQEGL